MEVKKSTHTSFTKRTFSTGTTINRSGICLKLDESPSCFKSDSTSSSDSTVIDERLSTNTFNRQKSAYSGLDHSRLQQHSIDVLNNCVKQQDSWLTVKRPGSTISGSTSIGTTNGSTASDVGKCCLFCSNSTDKRSTLLAVKKLRKSRKSAKSSSRRTSRSRSRSRSQDAQRHAIVRQQIVQEYRCRCGQAGKTSVAANRLEPQCSASSTSSFKFTRTGRIFSSFRRKNNLSKRKKSQPNESAFVAAPGGYDSFHYYGIPLQASVANYEFLRPPHECEISIPAKKNQHAAVLLAVSRTGKNNNNQSSTDRFSSPSRSSKFEKDDHPQTRRSFIKRYCSPTFSSANVHNPNTLEKSVNRPNTILFCKKEEVNCEDELYGIVRVHLRRGNGDLLGLGITGGADRHFHPVISYLRPGFIAHRSDQIQVGDRLIRVNGINVDALTHNEIMTVLRNAGSKITLDLEYNLNAPCFQNPVNLIGYPLTTEKCTEIQLINDADEDESEEEKKISDKKEKRDKHPLSLYGITLRGGAYGPDKNKSRPITITSIRPGGPAHREGRLRAGDRVLAIDEVDVSAATLSVAQNILKKARQSVQLTIAYNVSVMSTLERANGPFLLEIEKTPGVHFGVILEIRRLIKSTADCQLDSANNNAVIPLSSESIASKTTKKLHHHVVVIEKIIPASIADRCGAIHVGDEIHAIDGVSLEYTSLSECYQLLKSQCNVLRLELMPFNQIANSRRLLTLSSRTENKKQAIYCDYAPKNKTLPKKERQLLAFDRHDPITAKLSQNYSDKTQTVTNICHERFNSSPPESFPLNATPILSRSSAVERALARQMSASMSCAISKDNELVKTPSAPTSPTSRRAAVQSTARLNGAQIRQRRRRASVSTDSSAPQPIMRNGSVTTNFRHPLQSNGHHTPEPTGQLCHTETMEVVLNANSAGQSPLVKRRETLGLRPNMDSSPFGIELAYKDEADGICSMAPSTSVSATTPLIIEAIEKDSPADKCGVLQVGDRIHAINEWYTANGTIEEARYILRQAIQHAKIELLVEFNVIEPVLPSSGYFMVKLTRRGDNFGIVCRSETNGEKGEPTIISDIRTGSVAHRCGSIQIGDCIFAINNIFLDSYSVEEAMQLLQRSGNTVRLCIAKRGTIDTSSENSITYTVELSRKNQPLGITIGAAKGRANAVVISQIASNGLAERTGALHIGDRILAINGEPLAGKKLNYAIHLLQKSNDMVSLKIERAGPMISPSLGDMPQIAWRPGYDTASSGMHYSSDGNLINGLKMCVNSAALSTIPSDSVSEGGSSGKLETPLKSVDSAVESLEDSEMVNLQQRNVAKSTSKSIGNGRGVSLYHNDRVSTASEPVHVTHTIHSDHTNGAWDSGLSSVIDSAIGAHSIMPTTGAIASGDYCGGACGRSSSSGVVSSPGSSFKGHQKSIATTRNSATSPRTFSRHKIPEDEKEDWIRILEALETVGEEEMLRKLEDCIMGGRIDNNKKRDDHDFNGNYVTSFISAGFENNLANRSCKTYEKPLIPKHETKVNEQILSPEILSTKSMEYSPINPTTAFISSSMSYSSHTSNDGGLLSSAVKRVQESENGTMTGTMGTVSSGQSTIELPPPMFPLLSSSLQGVRPPIALPEPDTDSPIPFITSPNKYGNSSFEPVSPKLNNNFHKKELIHEIFNVTLDKDPETKSFGFSISDGNSINSGVFVNSVIKNSPAEGKIIPMDRILQINGTSIQFLDCDLAVPLLATDRVELLLLRKPINQTSEHDQFSAPSLSSPIPPFRGDF